jgi:hypothetical protein
MPSAASVTHGLALAFSELAALDEARQLRESIGKAEHPNAKSPKPSL